MSKWRRVAIKEIPSCKRIIEKTENSYRLSSDLFEALEDAYQCNPPQPEVIKQILSYFFPYPQPKSDEVRADEWSFFMKLPGSEALQDDLHNYVSIEQLTWIEENLRCDGTSEEDISTFHRRVLAARYKTKR